MLIILIRAIVLYLLIILALRLMGKKQLGELQPSELVTTILISNIATISIEDPSLPMLAGVIPILLIVSLDVIMSVVTLKSERIRRMVTGSPRILISGGQIDQAEMKNLRYTLDDLVEAMHDSGIFDLSEVQYAVVETTGKINFLEAQPPSDKQADPPLMIIKDGVLVDSALHSLGLDKKWLRQTLFDNNTTQTGVFYLTAKQGGAEYDLIKKQSQKRR